MIHIRRIDEMLGVGAEGRKALEDMYLGKTIRITYLKDEDDRYIGREGVVKHIDDIGQLHGTWGSLAVIPDEDAFEIVGTNESRLYEMAAWAHSKETFGVLAGTLMESVVECWKAHLLTGSYAAHEALAEYQSDMMKLADGLIEAYISIYGKVGLNFINTLKCDEPMAYAASLKDITLKYRSVFSEDPTIESKIDDVLGAIDTLLYKLKNLS